jgi:radical SAM protein with 4Fe4S-binding SPASM domain
MDEMEPFYDQWTAKAGSAVIVGPSDYAGQLKDLSVMNMAPPTRFACERIFTRAMVLADGRVTVCDQDFRGLHAVGSLATNSLSTLWTSEAMAAVRHSHQAGTYDGMPLCTACREWHRP